MKCFSLQKSRRRINSSFDDIHHGSSSLDDDADPHHNCPSPPPNLFLDPPSSSFSPARTFKSRVRAIQNAQRFIVHSNPRLRSSSSHPGYRSSSQDDAPPPPPPAAAARARSATELWRRSSAEATAAGDGDLQPAIYMPLPSPVPQQQSRYRLPLPAVSAASPNSGSGPLTAAFSSSSSSSSPPSTIPSTSAAANSNDSAASASTVASSLSPPNQLHPFLRPLPLPKASVPGLRHFSHHDLSAAFVDSCFCSSSSSASLPPSCGCFAGSVKISGKMQDAIALYVNNHQGFSEMVLEVSSKAGANTQNDHFCNLLGFCSEEEGGGVMVYERLQRGSLNALLFGGGGAAELQWPIRMNIATGVAQALSVLHEMSPNKVYYADLRTCHVQLDSHYSPKLAAYRFLHPSHLQAFRSTTPCHPRTHAYAAPETLSSGELTPKSNVWSYGVILLELLTGKQHMDEAVTRDAKQNLVKWARPFLKDEGRLFLLMDPKLQGKFPSKGGKMVADLVCMCLQEDPKERPSMKEVVEAMRNVQEARNKTGRLAQSKEWVGAGGVGGGNKSAAAAMSSMPMAWKEERPVESSLRSPTPMDLIQSPKLRPLVIPRRRCAAPSAMDEMTHHHHHQPDYQSAPLAHTEVLK